MVHSVTARTASASVGNALGTAKISVAADAVVDNNFSSTGFGVCALGTPQ